MLERSKEELEMEEVLIDVFESGKTKGYDIHF